MGRLIANTLQLGVLLSLVGVVGAGWMYYRSDELLRAEIVKQFAIHFPGSDCQLERANFDLRGRVRIFDFTLTLPGESKPFLTIPETILTIDQQELTERQNVIVQSVRISQPKVRLLREPDGKWNWEKLQFKGSQKNTLIPELEIVYGHAEVVLADHHSRTMVGIPIEDLMVTAKLSSARSYALTLATRTELTGRIDVRGDIPVEPGKWSLVATLARCRLDPVTTRLVLVAAPALKAQWAELRTRVAHWSPTPQAVPLPAAVAPLPENPYDLGMTAIAQVRLEARQESPETAPTWNAQLQLSEGQIKHPAFPSPLFDIQGHFNLDPAGAQVKNLTAKTGQIGLALHGLVTRDGEMDLHLAGTDIPINEALISRLPDSLQRHVRSLELTGMVSGRVRYQKGQNTSPEVEAEATLTGGTARPERFPYPVRNVTASMTWKHDIIQIQGEGLGGNLPVQLFGTIHRPGPEGAAFFEIRANEVSIDDTLMRALPPVVANVLHQLKARGEGDVWVRLRRPEGLNQKYSTILDANIREGSLIYSGFPYPLSQVSGRLHWGGDSVTFQQVQGMHDGAMFTGEGEFQIKPEPGVFTMKLQGTDVSFDRSLQSALPVALQEVWKEFSPQGQFDVAANVRWDVGSPAKVDVTKLQIYDGAFQMRNFAYPFQKLQGSFGYRSQDQVVEIHQFSAEHDDTRLSGLGSAQTFSDGSVTLTLDKLHVDDLTPTAAFRRAIPEPLRYIVETLNPTGKYSFHGPVTFYGQQGGGLVAAKWKLQVLLAGCALNAGLRIDDIHGRVRLDGEWTPQKTELDGDLDLDALDILLTHQFTRVKGPFILHDGVLTLGSDEMARSPAQPQGPRVTSDRRITGEAFDGDAALDAVVDLNGEPTYIAAMELAHANLEKYAQRHIRGYSNIRGLVNGWMEIRGRGMEARGLSGQGQLQISPAALYELPVFLQIFQLPQFAPINRTAFDFANFLFRIENERFNFQSIDLVGNTVSLKGRGIVRFDGAITLDFFTMQPRNQVRLPGLREIVGVMSMMSQGWLAIEVRGPIAAPVARVVPFPAVDDALQQFLGAFDGRSLAPPTLMRGPPRADPPKATALPPGASR